MNTAHNRGMNRTVHAQLLYRLHAIKNGKTMLHYFLIYKHEGMLQPQNTLNKYLKSAVISPVITYWYFLNCTCRFGGKQQEQQQQL